MQAPIHYSQVSLLQPAKNTASNARVSNDDEAKALDPAKRWVRAKFRWARNGFDTCHACGLLLQVEQLDLCPGPAALELHMHLTYFCMHQVVQVGMRSAGENETGVK